MNTIFILFVFAAPLAASGHSIKYTATIPDPPPHTEYAKMARYLVHKSSWTSLATISSAAATRGYPMVNVKAMADSKSGDPSTGNIYFLLTDLDISGKDLRRDNRVSILFSMDQDLSCTLNGTDTMEPTCARVIFSGHVHQLLNDTTEYNFAMEAMLSRHPAAKKWLEVHPFYLAKLDISQILLIDYYGGVKEVSVEDYYNANDVDSEELAVETVDIQTNVHDKDSSIHVFQS